MSLCSDQHAVEQHHESVFPTFDWRSLREWHRLRGNEQIERRLSTLGQLLAGVDEVGRGAVAGPVVAAAVVLPPGALIEGLDDSKRLSASRRDDLFGVIVAQALTVGVAGLSARIIDEIGIKAATLCAMRLAVERLIVEPEVVLVDGRDSIPGLTCVQEPIIRGDQRSNSIAAASIVAKVCRDRYMTSCRSRFPGYRFSQNKGYGTAAHMDAVEQLGLTVLHRHSFFGKGHQDQLSLFNDAE